MKEGPPCVCPYCGEGVGMYSVNDLWASREVVCKHVHRGVPAPSDVVVGDYVFREYPLKPELEAEVAGFEKREGVFFVVTPEQKKVAADLVAALSRGGLPLPCPKFRHGFNGLDVIWDEGVVSVQSPPYFVGVFGDGADKVTVTAWDIPTFVRVLTRGVFPVGNVDDDGGD